MTEVVDGMGRPGTRHGQASVSPSSIAAASETNRPPIAVPIRPPDARRTVIVERRMIGRPRAHRADDAIIFAVRLPGIMTNTRTVLRRGGI